MMKCKGCGIKLQYNDENKIGYSPKKGLPYCQRCFRIRNYNDVTISMKQAIPSEEVLSKIAPIDALILWVVDLFDFEADIITGIHRHLQGKDILLVATKRDLLPSSVGNFKLIAFMQSRLKAHGIKVKGIVVIGDLAKHANSDDNYSVEEVWNSINTLRKSRDVVVIGMANAGKSTMLNAMLGYSELTTSRYPGTTLDVNAIMMDGYTLYDTPGLTRDDSLLTHIDDKQLEFVIPTREVKQRSYQLREDQTLSLGGLVRLDLFGCENATCVAYFSERLQVHRGKQENADTLWNTHLGELLIPACHDRLQDMQCYDLDTIKEKTDIVIHGLGWFCISEDIKSLRIYVPKGVNVTFRKAMI